jgi:hypothetical protein
MFKRRIINPPLEIGKSFDDKFYRNNTVVSNEHTIPLEVNRYFTDVNGTIVDKALVPAKLKVNYPVYLFAQFDRNGGYRKSQQITVPVNGTYFLMTFTQGVNSPFLAFTGANNIKGKLNSGDVVLIYTDDLENPNYFVWIVITCNTVSFASILANTETIQDDRKLGVLYLKKTNYYVTIREQFEQALVYASYDNIGNFRSDSIQPNIFLSPFVDQQGFLTLETPYKIDQYIGMSFYMVFNCDKITMDFIVTKL